ncbi:MAG: SGNH/GDSL hydrolase family protein [Paucimonas sp.]|jgi:lysophospholipase L1-like esterase|nr:SGNH/GDSL hydrolase family protein [Paucimonas sp.]
MRRRFSLLILACLFPAFAAQAMSRDGNLGLLASKLRAAARAPVNVVQLGDSHTAADLFTGELRRLLQKDYGDGGIGLVTATPVPGTRYEQVLLKAAEAQWTRVSARNQQSGQFPLGGYLALPQVEKASVRLEARQPDEQRYRVSALYQAQQNASLDARDRQNPDRRLLLAATAGQWRFSPLLNNVQLPLELSVAGAPGLALGGWYVQGQKNAGVTLSALGINGAQLTVTDKWQAGWQETLKSLRPDLLILAYGTNEAFDPGFDLAQYREHLGRIVGVLRRQLPRAVIVLAGPPDSIRQRHAQGCAARVPAVLTDIVDAQREVAKANGALFWDWQGFMGGPCSIEQWQAGGLAQGDLIHLTAEGYRRSAGGLYGFLRKQLGLR